MIETLKVETLEDWELLELGRRMPQDVLERFGFLIEVIGAEERAWTRLASAVYLLRGILEPSQLMPLQTHALAAERQATVPERGSIRYWGLTAEGVGRRLPPAGTILVGSHRHHTAQARIVARPESDSEPERDIFPKFVVWDPKGALVLIGDRENVVHGSPTAAVKAASGGTIGNGWAFFRSVVERNTHC